MTNIDTTVLLHCILDFFIKDRCPECIQPIVGTKPKFFSLFINLISLFLPKIIYSIENRKSRIVNDLDEAQKLKEKAEKKLKEYHEIIEKSKKEAKKNI